MTRFKSRGKMRHFIMYRQAGNLVAMSCPEGSAGSEISSAVAAIQDFWHLCEERGIGDLIDDRAAELNRDFPIEHSGDLEPISVNRVGSAEVDEWVDLRAVTTDRSSFIKQWNGHKPEKVMELIKFLIRGGEDSKSVESDFRQLVCNPNNRIELTKSSRLGRPLYHVTSGNHRVHALRVIGVPHVPAIVWLPAGLDS